MVNQWALEGQAGFDKLNPVGRPVRYKFPVRRNLSDDLMVELSLPSTFASLARYLNCATPSQHSTHHIFSYS